MGVEKGLLGGVEIRPMESRPAGHGSDGEHLHFGALAGQVDPGLVPVDLGFVSPIITLRHEGFLDQEAHLAPALADVLTHGGLGDRGLRHLPGNPTMDAPCRVALLAGRAPILLQDAVDEGRDGHQFRPSPLRVTMRRRHRTRDGLPHHPAMDAELGRDAGDSADAEFMLPAELLEEFHFRDPIHSGLPGSTRATLGCEVGVGQNSASQVGQYSVAEPRDFAAQWLACVLPCRRFAPALAGRHARLGADVGRYSFIAVDLHHILLAGLPAH